jgi:NAD(P)H-hydrate epimerase
VIARHLNARGFEVEVLFFRSCHSPSARSPASDAATNLAILSRSTVVLTSLPDSIDIATMQIVFVAADWIVDALLGTGARGDPRLPTSVLIHAANATRARKLAVDVPSGLDCDTGIPGNPTFRADHTCTFVAPKIGFFQPPAQPYVGSVSVHDIGVPRKLLEEFIPG